MQDSTKKYVLIQAEPTVKTRDIVRVQQAIIAAIGPDQEVSIAVEGFVSIRCECIHCQKGLVVPDKYAGRSIRCPACKTELTVPRKSESATISIDSVDRSWVRPSPLERKQAM